MANNPPINYNEGSGNTDLDLERIRKRMATLNKPLSFWNLRSQVAWYIFAGSRDFHTRRVGLNTFLKAGRHIGLSEVLTMLYIAEHTSIPVPKIHRAWETGGVTFIIMERVRGVNLDIVWNNMNLRTQDHVVAQLKGFLAQLRALKPPKDGFVGGIDGGPFRDPCRIRLGQWGPFASHDDFHCLLRNRNHINVFKQLAPHATNTLISHSQKYETKFTHGDFAPRNIMVKQDGTIVAIIDWECSGWFPEYWEYTKANYQPGFSMRKDWVERIGEMTGVYPDQLAGEVELWDVCSFIDDPQNRIAL